MSTVFDPTDLNTSLKAKDAPLTWGLTLLYLYFTAAAIITTFTMGYLPWYMEGSAWSIPVLILMNLFLIFLPDYFLLPNFRRNAARMEREGVAHWRAHIAGSLALCGIGPWVLVGVLGLGLDATARFTLEAAAQTVACAFATDLPFKYAHMALHRLAPKHHLLHHMCIDPSMSTSFMMTIPDFLVEFFVPLGSVAVLALGVLGDPWVFLSSLGFTAAWYYLSHDPLVKLPHYYHHTQCDSRYNAYAPVKQSYDAKDKIRHDVFEIRRKERAMTLKK